MDPISKLTEYFREFPGIGPRQARRFVYFLLTRNPAYLDDIARLITSIKKSIRVCSQCFRFFQGESGIFCPTCADTSRNKNELMVVSRDVDFEAIEKSRSYSGYYFILGGTIPILDKEPDKRVRLKELVTRIKSDTSITEVILSLNANAEGEHTTDFIRDHIKQNAGRDIVISILGRGLSTGTELEYSDSETIKNALRNRGRV